MRTPYEFLLHTIEEHHGAHDVDATLARLGTQGWQIAGISLTAKGRLLVALQRQLANDAHGSEPLEEAGAIPLAAPNAHELERLPTLDLPPAGVDAPRAALVAQLQAYRAGDAREAQAHTRIATFVATHPDALLRSCAPGHITASAWVVDAGNSHALLVHHRKLQRWLQPGGHLEPGDATVADAAIREAREETGLRSLRLAGPAIFDLDVHAIPGWGDEAAHDHYDVRYSIVADREESLQHNEESLAARWFPLSQLIADGSDESVRRLARKSVGREITTS